MCAPRSVALAARLEREYLMLCAGHPWNGSGTRGTRVDALARIARAALASFQTAHLLFEDGTLLTLTPEFLGKGRPWGDHLQEASERRFRETLEDLLAGCRYQGATLRAPETLRKRVRSLLTDRRGKARFRLVLALHEDGCPLWSAMEGPQVGKGYSNTALLSAEPARVCVLLGGVRDSSDEEELAIQNTCEELRIPYKAVSLGQTPELTSKCIKAIEAADTIGFLAEALDCCASNEWQPAPKPNRPPHARAPFHVVAVLDVPLRDFVIRPEAANLLVDIFRGSHHSYNKAALSLLDTEGAALTIHNRDMEHILRERNALIGLRGLLRYARYAGLEQVLRSEHQRFSRKSGGRLLVLHMDESAPPLARAQASSGDTTGADTVAVIIVFGCTPELADAIESVCLELYVFARAAVGHPSVGLAFVSMLQNEGLLAHCIRASVFPPLLPEVADTGSARGTESTMQASSSSTSEDCSSLEVLRTALGQMEGSPLPPSGIESTTRPSHEELGLRGEFASGQSVEVSSTEAPEVTSPGSPTGSEGSWCPAAPQVLLVQNGVAAPQTESKAATLKRPADPAATLLSPQNSQGAPEDVLFSSYFYVGTMRVEVPPELRCNMLSVATAPPAVTPHLQL